MNRQEQLNILLIEDNPGDARLVENMLNEIKPNPVILHHASSLTAAQAYLQSHHIDLILLDLFLPDGNGLDAIKKIQRINNSLAIIILTGLDDQDFAIKTMKHGAQDYLIKGQGDGHLMLRAMHYAIERKHIEQNLVLLAHVDSLTGLANREYFNLAFSRSLALSKRKNNRLGLMFIDLDHFKEINDTLGHLIGDTLLICVAERLKKCVRSVDFIARLGGDEFVIILDDIQSPETIMIIAEKILSALSRSTEINQHKIYISCSIGITLFPDDALNINDLLKYADAAMYKAKNQGRNNFQFYTHELNAEIIHTISIKNDLRWALQRQEFSLFYQPKINVLNNKILGAEALLRWQHPCKGIILPDQFIPVAEQSGLIQAIGKWVITEAMKQQKKWQQSLCPDFRMAINLSVKQFQDNTLLNFITSESSRLALNASSIELEITETLLMHKNHDEHHILRKLSDAGFKISLDDFGTGYSSLSYLKHFTINYLKIDRSFIKDIASNSDVAEIVKAIIVMAHALKLTVVAEGVENDQQLAFLKQLNCNEVQGYLISKPIAPSEFEQFFRKKNETS